MFARVKRFFRAVVQAVKVKGPKLLASLVPGGEVAYDLSVEIAKQLKAQPPDDAKGDLEAVVQDVPEVIAQAADEAIGEADIQLLPAEKDDLLTLLKLIPETARRSLQRPDDHSGTTVPVDFSLHAPENIRRIIPDGLPKMKPGDRLPSDPKWELLKLLGKGGFGEAWLAKHRQSESRLRVLKFCTDPAAHALLKHEMRVVEQVLANGPHAGIVTLEDFDLEAEMPWLRYEYVKGGELSGLIHAKKNLPGGERSAWAADVIRQLAATAGHFHALKPAVVHSDLKPANILVENDKLKITDFGIGRAAARRSIDEAKRMTVAIDQLPTAVRGACTLLYASPQQQDGEKADVRDDIYSLGVIWYQMVKGDMRAKPRLGKGWKTLLAKEGTPADHLELMEACFDGEADARPDNGTTLAEEIAKLLAPGARSASKSASESLAGAAGSGPPPLPPGARSASKGETPILLELDVAPPPPSPPETPAQRVKRLRDEAARLHAKARSVLDLYDFEEAARLLESFRPELLPQREDDLLQDTLHKRDRLRSLHRDIHQLLDAGKLKDPRLSQWIGAFLAIKPNDAEKIELAKEFPPPRKGSITANSRGIKFSYVPSGTFWMGGTAGQCGDKQVTIADPFYLGVHPVTQAQWQALMGNNPSHFHSGNQGGPEHPVEQVSWKDVQEFLKKLNAKERDSGWLYRIPTEAEWEYACRGAATTEKDCDYDFYFDRPTNDITTKLANYDDEIERTTKVGSYKPNALGLYDMHGNVWEWCDDKFDGGSAHVVRGGSWAEVGGLCRAANRHGYAPSDSGNDVGFRLARVPSSS